MLTSNIQLCYVLTRGGGQAVQGGVIFQHLLQEYLVERDINFISVNLRCLLQRSVGLRIDKGWGQAVQGSLSCPLLRISNRMDNQQFLLHHLLQKCLVERDINFISVNLRCLLQTFSWVTY